jgi:hypothetical protein
MTTITNFESYDYTVQKYKKDVSSVQQCRNIMGLTLCTGVMVVKKYAQELIKKKLKKVYMKLILFFWMHKKLLIIAFFF